MDLLQKRRFGRMCYLWHMGWGLGSWNFSCGFWDLMGFLIADDLSFGRPDPLTSKDIQH